MLSALNGVMWSNGAVWCCLILMVLRADACVIFMILCGLNAVVLMVD